MSSTERDLLELAVAASFTHDAQGRIGYDNEPGGTAHRGSSWHAARPPTCGACGTTCLTMPSASSTPLAAAEPVTSDLRAPPHHLDAYLTVLRASQPIAAVEFGPAYRFPDHLPTPGTTTTITRANLELLRHMVGDLADVERDFETGQPSMVVVVDGYAVSVCFSARLTARVASAGVETLPAYRGRGYATAVVADWARAVRASGRIPLYGTSWENSASQGVARRLG